ncbi:Actin-like protein arp9 [Ranunculus cassubicifolius]
MDYLKSVVPSQLMAERGSNLLVINPGSANVRIGLAQQQIPLNIPHCIARYINDDDENHEPILHLQDQALNSRVTPGQEVEREKAYDTIASLLKIPFLDEDVANNSIPRKTVRVDGYKPQNTRNDSPLTWTDVTEKNMPVKIETKDDDVESSDQSKSSDGESDTSANKYREYICGEDALKIPPSKPYSLHRPIRRGHFNISQHYPQQQVLEDLYTIWDWVLNEKLHIPHAERNLYSVVLVIPESFDTREIKEILTILLRDLRFSSAVVHQEGLAAVFGNGLSTACVVNMGAQVTSIICVEDGVTLPTTALSLPFGGEDISRCLLWSQRHHQTWPSNHTNPLSRPIDLLMLNKLKESYCRIKEGEVDTVALVHSYDDEDNMQSGAHKTRLSSLNVPPMGVFYPLLLVPDEHPPPPRTWFLDYEDMLEDTWHLDYSNGGGGGGGLSTWDNYQTLSTRLKKVDNLGLAEAITSSILSTGRIDLQRKLFCSIQLVGGVALTGGLIAAVEDRVLHAIPSNEAIDTVEVLQPKSDSTFVPWRGGAIIGILDFGREAWIHRDDWIPNGIHVASGRKYKDSFYLQAQAMCYMNS